jgi:hypothetical protein
VFTFVEHFWAGNFLARMKAVPDWPPWIPAQND